ncbi:hypothetical protein [Cystobacter fuscus]|uniref:hypothetical protein n=1 Tax=Cystobacter fuscus TaxID=43 RepID=UPI002B298EA6|nr:hypothetical protein F0U63_43030 [Cystobacter fuscus]
MNTRLRSTLHASSLLSTLLLASMGCTGGPVQPPDEDPTDCEGTNGCGSLSSPACSRVHLWDVFQFGTDQDDTGVVVGADGDCNIYVAGNTRGRFSGGGDVITSEAGAMQDIFSIRLPAVMPPEDPSDSVDLPFPRVIQLGSSLDDSVKDFAIADDRTVFLVGATAGQMPGASEPGQGFNDIFATKLNSRGQREWTQQYGSAEEDSALAVALRREASGVNVYIAGTTQEQVDRGFEITLDILGPTGAAISRATYGTIDHDRAEGLALDASGNIFIVGSTMGDYSEPGSHAGSTDAFVTKIAQQNLAEEEWKSQIATSDIDAALDVVVDADGNVYVLAVSFSDLDEGQSENDGIQNSFLIKYAAGSGRPEWTRRIGSKSQYSRATGLALDAQKRIYVAGFTTGSMVEGVGNKGGRDAFVARYDAEGVKNWARQIGTAGTDEASDVVVTKAGDVVITGFTTGDLWGLGNQGRQDAFIARFNPSSQP